MGEADGSRGGRPHVLGSRFTGAELEAFMAKKGTALNKAQAVRLAILEWPGLNPAEPLSAEVARMIGLDQPDTA